MTVDEFEYCRLTGKRRYQSRSDATRAKAGLHRRGGLSKLSRPVSAYLCRACGAWHLGRERA
jgi:hypothetical protein